MQPGEILNRRYGQILTLIPLWNKPSKLSTAKESTEHLHNCADTMANTLKVKRISAKSF